MYVSSSPSSAARKAVSKLCATDKKKKVQFSIREITRGSKRKTYGPYFGYIEKLKEPIELKGRIIKYKPVAKLSDKKTKTEGAKKKGSILVVKTKDGKVSTKKETDKKMKKTYHKGGQPEKRSRLEGEENTTNLSLLANISSRKKNKRVKILDEIKATELLSDIKLPKNIQDAKFIDYNTYIMKNKLDVGNIIECKVDPNKYPNQRWFGIVTGITGTGVYVKWFKENTLNLEKIKRERNSDHVDFDLIKGVIQL